MPYEEKLAHAYLIASGSAAEREEMARSLAQRMVCEGEPPRPCGQCRHCRKTLAGIHPDVIVFERERDDKGALKREFSVGRIRELLADAWVRPNEAQRKVYILPDAQTLNVSAQNAMLKLLEEPPGGACFILCADNAAALLDTVRSRCVELVGTAAPDTAYDDETLAQVKAYLAAAAAEKLPALLRLLSEWEKLDTERMRLLLAALRDDLTEKLCLRADAGGLDRARLKALLALISKAEDYLRANVSTKHILGLLSVETIVQRQS